MDNASIIREHDFQGQKRWPSFAQQRMDGGRYYTFQEWIEHCDGDEDFAKELWLQAYTEDMDREWMVNLKHDIDVLDPVFPEQLLALPEQLPGKVVLQWCCSGNSLRAGDEGEVELGGAGPRAQLNLEIHGISHEHAMTTYDISLRCESCPCSGKHLRESAEAFDFLGTPESSGVIFKMFFAHDRESKATLVSLVSTSGRYLGLFALKWAWDPAWARREWLKELLHEASKMVEKDPMFIGKKYHPLDTSKSCFTFPEWVQFIVEHGWGGPFSSGAWVLSTHVWQYECIVDPDDVTTDSGNGWFLVDSDRASDCASDCMQLD